MRNALFLLLSVALGWGLTIMLDGMRHLRLALPIAVSLAAAFLLLALVVYWLTSGLAKKHGTGHPAKDLLRQGHAFRVWFTSHGLLWALLNALAMVLCIKAFYWQWWVIAMVAGFSSALVASLIGMVWTTRSPLLGLCWRDPKSAGSPLQFSKYLSLKLRYDDALGRDFHQEKPQVPYLMAILEQGRVAGIARYVRLQPKDLPWRQELSIWLRGMGLLSGASALLFFMMLLLLSGLNQFLDAPLRLPGNAHEQQVRLDPSQQAQSDSDLANAEGETDKAKPGDETQDAGESQEQQGAEQKGSASAQSSDSGSPAEQGQQGDSGTSSNDTDGSQAGQQGQQAAEQGHMQPSPSGSTGQQGLPAPSQGQQAGGGSGQAQPGPGQQGENSGQDQPGQATVGEGAAKQGSDGQGEGAGSPGEDAPQGGRKKHPGKGEGAGGQAGGAGQSDKGGESEGGGQGKGKGQGSGSGSGGGGQGQGGYGTGGDAPKLGDARAISMPPPGVGEVITIEAPEQKIEGEADPNADTENARADDQPAKALTTRDKKRTQTDAQVEKQEGQSLQYLPNWIRHLKKKSDQEQGQQ